MPHAIIEGMEFTLFYDYDQLYQRKLSRLSDLGLMEWLSARMQMVFVEPVSRILDPTSRAHLELHSHSGEYDPPRTLAIAIFSTVLNGVEACGSFLGKTRNRDRFVDFIIRYMRTWDKHIKGTHYRTDYLPDILWHHFRNAIAHQFSIEGGGIEYELKKRWVVRSGMLEVNPRLFFEDFLRGMNRYFRNVRKVGSAERASFLRRFQAAYPH